MKLIMENWKRFMNEQDEGGDLKARAMALKKILYPQFNNRMMKKFLAGTLQGTSHSGFEIADELIGFLYPGSKNTEPDEELISKVEMWVKAPKQEEDSKALELMHRDLKRPVPQHESYSSLMRFLDDPEAKFDPRRGRVKEPDAEPQQALTPGLGMRKFEE